ncbi:MAG: PD-(D/E)XK nuclease family transposase, partial [Bacteroidales bacterium]
QIVNIHDTEKQIKGLEFVFVELPKFKPEKISEKKLQVLWLRFLTEIDERSTEIPKELLLSEEIKEAVEKLRSSAFSKAELESYDKYWDAVRVETTLQEGAYSKGIKDGLEKGLEKGREEGRAEERLAMARNGILSGLSDDIIKTLTNLTDEQIEALRREVGKQ